TDLHVKSLLSFRRSHRTSAHGTATLPQCQAPHPPAKGVYAFSSAFFLTCSRTKASSAATWSATFAVGLPMPWPALVSTRRSTGLPEVVSARRVAAILRACIGSTRESLSAVQKSIAGYAAGPAWWSG